MKVFQAFIFYLKNLFKNKIFLLFITGFFIGYLIASLMIFLNHGVVLIDKKGNITKQTTFWGALNPFWHMNPGSYLILFGQK